MLIRNCLWDESRHAKINILISLQFSIEMQIQRFMRWTMFGIHLKCVHFSDWNWPFPHSIMAKYWKSTNIIIVAEIWKVLMWARNTSGLKISFGSIKKMARTVSFPSLTGMRTFLADPVWRQLMDFSWSKWILPTKRMNESKWIREINSLHFERTIMRKWFDTGFWWAIILTKEWLSIEKSEQFCKRRKIKS
jgi:hypothetical protein